MALLYCRNAERYLVTFISLVSSRGFAIRSHCSFFLCLCTSFFLCVSSRVHNGLDLLNCFLLSIVFSHTSDNVDVSVLAISSTSSAEYSSIISSLDFDISFRLSENVSQFAFRVLKRPIAWQLMPTLSLPSAFSVLYLWHGGHW